MENHHSDHSFKLDFAVVYNLQYGSLYCYNYLIK